MIEDELRGLQKTLREFHTAIDKSLTVGKKGYKVLSDAEIRLFSEGQKSVVTVASYEIERIIQRLNKAGLLDGPDPQLSFDF